MKVKLILFSLTLLISTITRAQVQLGLKAGYNIANLLYTGLYFQNGQKSLSNFNVGAITAITLSRSFSIQSELTYSGQGNKYNDGTSEGSNHYDYINLPVLLSYHHSAGFFVETGLQIGFLVRAFSYNGRNGQNIRNRSYSPDYSYVIGTGYQLPRTNLGIDARYNFGLLNITHQLASDGSIKNSVFQIGLFYLFWRGK